MKKVISGFLGMMLIPMLLTGCAGDSNQAEVTVATAKSGKDLSSMVWQGTVQPLSSIDIMANGSGKIVEIPVQEGQHVEQGTILFQVDNADMSLQLEQAKASYQAAEAAFVNAEKASQQNTSVKPAEISYNLAKDNFNRIQALYSSGAVSQADYENVKAQMDSAAAQLTAARNGQNSNYDVTKAQMDSARAAVDIVQKMYDDCTVTTPITGLVTKVEIEIGQMVSPQVKAVTVIDDSGKKVEVQVADMDIDQLAAGMPMNVSIQPLSESCQGTISEISAVGNTETGMFTVKVLLEEDSKVGYIGLMADLRVSENEESVSVYIPAKCLQSDEDGTFVYKIVDGSAVRTSVVQGKKKNAYCEVSEGLVIGDEVVMQSSKPLEEGTKVRVLTVK